jgi:CheY-like chemotaxis protein
MTMRCLIVDDELGIQQALRRLLAMWGHESCTASSGEEALALLEHEAFDLILLDYRMPGLSGVVSELGPDEVTLVQRNASDGSVFTPLTNLAEYVTRSQALPRGFRWLDLVDGYLSAAANASHIGRLS